MKRFMTLAVAVVLLLTCAVFTSCGSSKCDHEFNKGKKTKAPTCTEEGVLTRTCVNCGETKEEPIDKLEHEIEHGVIVKENDCGNAGLRQDKCKNCDYVESEEELPATGYHYYEEETTPATCKDPGEIVSTCSVCGDEQRETLEPTDEHKWENGKCSVCEKTLDSILQDQPAIVTSATYEYADSHYEMIANVKNVGTDNIRDITIRFAGWDKDGFPARVYYDKYVYEIKGGDVNLAPGGVYVGTTGQRYSDNFKASTVRAIVYSYTTFDNETWINPAYDSWEQVYVGKVVK